MLQYCNKINTISNFALFTQYSFERSNNIVSSQYMYIQKYICVIPEKYNSVETNNLVSIFLYYNYFGKYHINYINYVTYEGYLESPCT